MKRASISVIFAGMQFRWGLSILFKACLFNLTFHKGSHSKGLKQKSTACASKKNKTFHRKVFWATFHGSTNLFEKCG